MIYDVVGWIATILNILGIWFLPRRKYLAVCLFIGTSTCFLIWGVYDRAWNVVALQVICLVLNIRTIVIWRKSNGTRVHSRSRAQAGDDEPFDLDLRD